MTKQERETIQECIDATVMHFNAIDNLDTGLASNLGLDGVAEGLAITESKLRTLLRTKGRGANV